MSPLGLILVLAVQLVACDVSHVLEKKTTTEPPIPRPYAFSYSAEGRVPGHTDRQHSEVSDGTGVVRGSFSYLDPRNKVRTVEYVADRQGFHPVLSEEAQTDTEAVARAKHKHFQLYAQIADDHAHHPYPKQSSPRQTAAVSAAARAHAALFAQIAEQHARIAAERELIQREQEEQEKLHEDLER